MRAASVTAAVCLAVLTACGDGGDSNEGADAIRLPPLVVTGACSQLFVFGATEARDRAITVGIPALGLGTGVAAGVFDVGEDDLAVELLRGAALTDPLCNDLTGQDYLLDEQVPIVAGKVDVRVHDRQVDISFTDLRTASGQSIEVDRFHAIIGAAGG